MPRYSLRPEPNESNRWRFERNTKGIRHLLGLTSVQYQSSDERIASHLDAILIARQAQRMVAQAERAITLTDLRKAATAHAIPGRSTMDRPALLDALRNIYTSDPNIEHGIKRDELGTVRVEVTIKPAPFTLNQGV